MAIFTDRYPLNVPGKFYIDAQCTDCDLCRECAPNNITRDDRMGHSYVFKQPENQAEVAAIMHSKWELGLEGAVVVANPIPEADEIPSAEIEPVITAALAEADRLGIRGKDVTPFLLSEIVKASKGRSLQANIALVKNNAKVAAEIAAAFARL